MSDDHLNHPDGPPWKTPESCPAMPAELHNETRLPIEGPDGIEINPGEKIVWTGLSAREHAAIQLRLPDSGTPWLDEMIAKARVLDIATTILAAKEATRVVNLDDCSEAHDTAHAMLDEVLTEPRLV